MTGITKNIVKTDFDFRLYALFVLCYLKASVGIMNNW